MGYAYVGCRTTRERNARGKGLKVYEISGTTGDFKEIQCLETLPNPSYQTMDLEERFLYSVHGDISCVSSFRINGNGTLCPLNTIDIGGRNPVYITPDRTNRYLIVAALQGGAVYVIRKEKDGSLGEIVHTVHMEGKEEGTISFAHQCIWDQKKQFLFVVCQARLQGYGQIIVYRFRPEDGTLTETDRYRSREYDEPRHLSIHPGNRFVYLINEKGNTMTFLEFDDEKGKLTARQILPTLPDVYTGQGQASASVMSKNGKILIGSNRIHESVVLYHIDQHTGYMKEIGYYPTLGMTPRFISFNRDYSLFYAANEDSDTIVEMKLDEENGRMDYTGRVLHTESPVCITFK